MLKIRDKKGKLKFVLDDEAEKPISIDDLILQDPERTNKALIKKEKDKEI